MEIVSLKYDFSFKQLMLNEEVRKYFISDVLGIPAGEIRSVRLANPFLWRRYAKQKQGILDVRVELNDNSRVNIELQIRMVAQWDKRSLFYLAKMFTEDLLSGERYHKLKKCICINILDFDLNESPAYHRRYKLRDENGEEFSDMFEIHVIELKKQISGDKPLDDWIRLFNAETEAELDMIKTKNPGILEAVKEVKVMSLRKDLRALYEGHMREIRDKYARDDYVREEGEAVGRVKGKAEGKAEDVLQLLSLKGPVPEGLEQRIREQKDMDTLSSWLVTAARAESVEEFEQKEF
ncbi:MAG: Rpn family recombination-promoting nuclease/putative transposase [Firmicutes bacterium]|nr:Rpn family recombination-promoting nuclease/putative transposase [Bacillota bacterium]